MVISWIEMVVSWNSVLLSEEHYMKYNQLGGAVEITFLAITMVK